VDFAGSVGGEGGLVVVDGGADLGEFGVVLGCGKDGVAL
jgi:hypothetical protein